jgi:hypothetical protein
MIYTIEDYIEILSGVVTHDDQVLGFTINSNDQSLIFSLAKQCIRGTALTDRQFELAKQKIVEYKDQFYKKGFDELTIENLRQPLREIDRSKWIKNNNTHISIRFPFTKKMIKYIEFLQNIGDQRLYDKKNKIHYVELNETNIYTVIDKFKNANFDIDDNLKIIYENILHMKNKKEEYAPGIFGLKLKNLHNKAIDYALSSIGEPDIENLARYKDKQEALGIVHFDEDDLLKSLNATQPLTRRIVYRKNRHVFIDNNEFTIDNVVESLLELHRFPILVMLPDNESSLDLMHLVQKSFKNIIPTENITNLFRKDNTTPTNIEYNNYIQENKLNNSLANSTKLVYTSNNKIPKSLMQTDWIPSVAINLESKRLQSLVDHYLNDLDLVIHYDNISTPWANYVEKI